MSDTRTNSGVDNISSYKKIFNWTKNNKASIPILTAGNLATTQALVSEINGRNVSDNSRALELFNQTTMFQASKFVGKKLKKIILLTLILTLLLLLLPRVTHQSQHYCDNATSTGNSSTPTTYTTPTLSTTAQNHVAMVVMKMW